MTTRAPHRLLGPGGVLQRGPRFAVAVVLAVVLALGLGSCLVNQGNLALVDMVDPGGPVAVRAENRGVAYGPDPAQVLDVYLPQGTPHGTLIYIHSGGWTGGTRADIPAVIFQQLNRGWAVVSIDHRLAGTPIEASEQSVRAPQVLADVDRAIRFVRANGPALGLDTSTLVASGWSAGAHLALMAATAPGWRVDPGLPAGLAGVSPAVDAVVALAATSDLATWARANPLGQTSVDAFLGCSDTGNGGLPPCAPNTANYNSPAFRALFAAFLHLRLPPAYIATGAIDPIVPVATQGQPLYDYWSAAAGDGATYFDVPPTGGHDVSLTMNKTIFDFWLNKVRDRSF